VDENSEPWYTNENVPENPLSVVKRTSEKIWNKELIDEFKILIEVEKGPLVKYYGAEL